MCEKGENGVNEVKTGISGGALHAGGEKISCDKCRFWAAVVVGSKGEELKPEQIKVGACKFNPPVFVNQLGDLGSPRFPSPRKDRTVQAWPDTKVDDWCGRFEPKWKIPKVERVEHCHGAAVASEDIRAGRAVCFGDDGKVVNAVKDVAGEIDALRDKALRVNGYSAGDMREQWEGLTRKELKALREMSRRYAGGDDVFNKELAELVIGMEPELVNEGAKAFDGYFVHWDKIIEVCAKAWPGERADYGECPTELICRIIDERDDERRFLKRVIRQNQKLIDTIAEAVEILGPEVEVTPETPGYVLIRVRALKELRKGIEAVTVEPTRTVEVEGTESTNEFCGCRGGY